MTLHVFESNWEVFFLLYTLLSESNNNNKTQMTWHPKPSCKPCGAPAQNPRSPRARTLGDTADQHCLAFNLA